MSSPKMRQAVVTVVLLSSSAWWFPPALAQERVIGLLALPGVFGRGACDRFAPRPVALHDTPQGRGSGTVLVLEPWTHDSRGGCEGLEVGVRVPGAAAVQQLPTKEYAYEAPGAIVLERRGTWFRVRLASGSAWLESSAPDLRGRAEALPYIYLKLCQRLTPTITSRSTARGPALQSTFAPDGV
jgi:hypothetical protein